MKKIIPYILIIISLVAFSSLLILPIFEDELPPIVLTGVYILIGYISISLFAYGWIILKKQKKK